MNDRTPETVERKSLKVHVIRLNDASNDCGPPDVCFSRGPPDPPGPDGASHGNQSRVDECEGEGGEGGVKRARNSCALPNNNAVVTEDDSARSRFPASNYHQSVVRTDISSPLFCWSKTSLSLEQ